ncbi:MAG: class I SAM-dependent methyltransferase [Chroococcidiopsidaceae cyanobacterium CP_BM_ER_R8_30]|nr:class I SAM-dependent methyltransferase [Chroococcidiopsidaceae cyanobacterium CP_BM_ER_R8_30]
MSVFGSYARYYNLLYRDKDYDGEAQFVDQLLQRSAPEAKSVLELGCGTGIHAMLLAKAGYQVHGVDLSAEMLQQATERLSCLPAELVSRLKFSQGDIRNIRLEQQFDAVLSLFHVISYQTTNQDLLAALATARSHLQPGGVFIFDCWYGPTVLSNRPAVRVKRLEDEEISVVRIAQPVMYPNENLVDVNYQVFIKQKSTGSVAELQETHQMRYLFEPEINLLFSQSGFEYVTGREWMTNQEPGWDTWGVYFVAQATEVSI